jgi:hypothetical protein
VAGGSVVALALVVDPSRSAGTRDYRHGPADVCRELALLAMLSTRWTGQPQRWAAPLAGFMGAGRRRSSRLCAERTRCSMRSGGSGRRSGWRWSLQRSYACAGICTAAADCGSLYPLLTVYALCAVGGCYQTIRESLDRRTYPATGQLVDVGGHRLHLQCVGTGSPTVHPRIRLGETMPIGHGFRLPSHARPGCASTIARVEGGAMTRPVPQDGVAVATYLHTLLDRARVPGPFVLVATRQARSTSGSSPATILSR